MESTRDFFILMAIIFPIFVLLNAQCKINVIGKMLDYQNIKYNQFKGI